MTVIVERVRILHIAAIEVRMLIRAAGPQLMSIAVCLAVILKLQEPRFASGSGVVDFYWSSLEAWLSVLLASIPLVWAVTRRDGGRRFVVAPFQTATSQFLAIFAFGAALSGLVVAVSITLQSIHGMGRGLLAWLRMLAVLAPMSSLGVCLPSLSLSAGMTAFVWTALVAGSFGIFGLGLPIPADRLVAVGSLSASASVTLMAPLLTTLAGVLISAAVLGRSRR